MAGRAVFDEDAIQRLFHGPDGEIAKALTRVAVQVEGGAKRRAPVDTGRLRSSITHTPVERDGDELVARIGTDVEYAPYVELGTRHQVAQPFLRPALDDAKL